MQCLCTVFLTSVSLSWSIIQKQCYVHFRCTTWYFDLYMHYKPSRSICPWDFPGKNTGVGCHFLYQGIFLTQGSNPHLLKLLHWQADSLTLHHLGGPQTLWNDSVQFSHSVVSDSLWAHGLQHARPPCPSPNPAVYPNSCPSYHVLVTWLIMHWSRNWSCTDHLAFHALIMWFIMCWSCLVSHTDHVPLEAMNIELSRQESVIRL